jgi:hypothetical protein
VVCVVSSSAMVWTMTVITKLMKGVLFVE